MKNVVGKNQTKIQYLLWRYNDDPIDKSQDTNYILVGHPAGGDRCPHPAQSLQTTP